MGSTTVNGTHTDTPGLTPEAAQYSVRLMDGDVDVADGSGRQAAPFAVALAVGEQSGIERVEVLGPQLLYGDVSDVGVDVQADDALV